MWWSGEAGFKAMLIALPQQGQPDFGELKVKSQSKQRDPHTVLAAAQPYTDPELPDWTLEQLSSGYFPVYWVVTCPWQVLSELMFDSMDPPKSSAVYRISSFREFWSSGQGSLLPPFEQNLIKEQKPPRHLHSGMLHKGKQLEKEDTKPCFNLFPRLVPSLNLSLQVTWCLLRSMALFRKHNQICWEDNFISSVSLSHKMNLLTVETHISQVVVEK